MTSEERRRVDRLWPTRSWTHWSAYWGWLHGMHAAWRTRGYGCRVAVCPARGCISDRWDVSNAQILHSKFWDQQVEPSHRLWRVTVILTLICSMSIPQSFGRPRGDRPYTCHRHLCTWTNSKTCQHPKRMFSIEITGCRIRIISRKDPEVGVLLVGDYNRIFLTNDSILAIGKFLSLFRCRPQAAHCELCSYPKHLQQRLH